MLEDERIGERIRRARERRGLTQRQLAERTGYSQSTVAGWESGRRGCRLEALQRVARVLNLSIGELVPDASHVREGSPDYRWDDPLDRSVARLEAIATRLEAALARLEAGSRPADS